MQRAHSADDSLNKLFLEWLCDAPPRLHIGPASQTTPRLPPTAPTPGKRLSNPGTIPTLPPGVLLRRHNQRVHAQRVVL